MHNNAHFESLQPMNSSLKQIHSSEQSKKPIFFVSNFELIKGSNKHVFYFNLFLQFFLTLNLVL